jgi:hypothetical protein
MEQLRLIGTTSGAPLPTLMTISDPGEQDAVAARTEELKGKALARGEHQKQWGDVEAATAHTSLTPSGATA